MLSLFFAEPSKKIGSIGELIELAGAEGHHAVTVLRIEVGEHILISDGRGTWAEVVVKTLSKGALAGEIISTGILEKPSVHLTVLQALPKSSRSRETVELLVEGGAHTIIPWAAQRSITQWQSTERKKDPAQGKWLSYIREASKQSRRFDIPVLGDLAKAGSLVDLIRSVDLALVFHETAENTLSKTLATVKAKSISSALIIIGPEGGVTEAEIEKFLAAGAHLVQIGKPIFRSAHAGIAALAALQAGLQIW